MKICDMVFSRI